MTEKLEAFAELVRSAEAAASRFDGNTLSRKSEELGRHVEWLLQQTLTPQEFEHVHRRLADYRDLCAFLQSTLHGALMRAAGDESCAVYGAALRSGNPSDKGIDAKTLQPLQPLLRRYA